MKMILLKGTWIQSGPAVIGPDPEPGSWMDHINKFADKVIGAEQDHIANPAWGWIKGQLVDAGHWFVTNLPDIMGYGAIFMGAMIILGSMMGKQGMLKPIGVYAGTLIVAVCILSGAKGV